MIFLIFDCRQNGIAEAAIVIVTDIDNALLLLEEFWKGLESRCSQRVKLHEFQAKRDDLGQNQTRLLSNKISIPFLNDASSLMEMYQFTYNYKNLPFRDIQEWSWPGRGLQNRCGVRLESGECMGFSGCSTHTQRSIPAPT